MPGHVRFVTGDVELGSTHSTIAGVCSMEENVMNKMEELRYAVVSEQLDVVRKLLSKVNQKTLHEYSAMASSYPLKRPLLHLAVMKKNPEILKTLLDETVFRILINERDVDGYTPIMLAADVGSAECFRILMDAGANLSLSVLRNQNERTRELHTLHTSGKTLAPSSKIGGSMTTHIAAAKGHADILTLLLQRIDVRLDLEEVDDQGCTALMVAVANGNVHCMNKLLSVGARCADVTNNAAQNVLHLAAKHGHYDVLKELLKKTEVKKMINNEDSKSYTPISWAIVSGNVECMQILLDCGADQHVRDDKNNSLLHLACREGHSHILEALLPTSLKFVHYKDEPSYQHTFKHTRKPDFLSIDEIISRKQIMKLCGRTTYWWYLQDIKHKNKDGRNCFHLAASSGNEESLKLLFLCYATSGDAESIKCPDIDEKDIHGLTPLYYAARSSSAECVRFLLKNGGNLAFKSKASRRSLIGSSEEKVIKLILNNVESGELIIKEVFDDCVRVTGDSSDEEVYRLDFNVLCPQYENKIAVAKMLYNETKSTKLQQHPLLLAFIHLDWREHKRLMYYRFINHVFFLTFLTACITNKETFYSGYVAPWLLFPFAILVILFSLPYLLSGYKSKIVQIFQFVVTAFPGSLALYIVFSEESNDIKAIAILISWLLLPLHARIFPVIGRQISLFMYVINETLKYAGLFLYVLLGFSFAFDILYLQNDELTYKTFLQSYLYTILVILRGRDQRGHDFHNDPAQTDFDLDSYLTRVIDEMRFVGIVVSLLFILVVTLALLNLFIVIAFRSAREMEKNSYFHYKRAQVQMLYEKRVVDNFLERILCPLCKFAKRSDDEQENVIYVKRSNLDTTIDKGLWNIVISRRKKLIVSSQKKSFENEVDSLIDKRIKQIHRILSDEELKLRGKNGFSHSSKSDKHTNFT